MNERIISERMRCTVRMNERDVREKERINSRMSEFMPSNLCSVYCFESHEEVSLRCAFSFQPNVRVNGRNNANEKYVNIFILLLGTLKLSPTRLSFN
jgi:hypothetical protein